MGKVWGTYHRRVLGTGVLVIPLTRGTNPCIGLAVSQDPRAPRIWEGTGPARAPARGKFANPKKNLLAHLPNRLLYNRHSEGLQKTRTIGNSRVLGFIHRPCEQIIIQSSFARFVDECGVLGEVHDSPNLRIHR